MKTTDGFLRDIISTGHARASDCVSHLGYEYGQVESYFDRIRADRPDWLDGFKTTTPDIIRMRCRGERAKWEIQAFLAWGGYARIERKRERAEETGSQNLRLIGAQQKEIRRNALYSMAGFAMSAASLLVAGIALLRSCTAR